ncbi:MAG: metallopeptidase family protein [Verrucomicrobia subdivision 3 bacterium]|nr:metallopeptidase family protein [Limisphaerales bacterium]
MSVSFHWQEMLGHAEREVAQTLSSLPPALREKAKPLPVCYERRPGRDLLSGDSDEEDLLGLFVGSSYADTPDPIPQHIILFLENIWSFAEGDLEIFREEVRATYLHELGHYLGLDEDGLLDRGL